MATELPATAASSPRPTRVRYGVLAFLCALSFVLYIDRICIAQAASAMKAEFHISNATWGLVLNAFLLAYGLFEVPTGRWGDRYGSRGVLLRIVLWWSAFTALTGCVPALGSSGPLWLGSFLLLILVRFLFGAGEAGALPNAARVVARWFPAGRRGPAQGLVNTSTLVGGAVTPVMVAYLIELAGWRWAFVLFGALGIVWAVAFYGWFRDNPALHPAVNEAERVLIDGGAAAAPHAPHPRVPWKRVLTSANVWLAGAVISCSAFSTYIYFAWYPTYLKEGRGVSNVLSGWLSSLVLAGGAVGCTLGGYLGDWVVRRTGERRWSRRAIGAGGLGCSALALAAGVACDSPVASAACTALAALCAGATLATWWAVITDISGKHVGALFGLMNSMGVPGAFLSQQLFGTLAHELGKRGYSGRAQWDPGLLVSALVLLTGAAGWLFIDSSRSAVEAPGKDPV